jgi:hypothetical protein
MILRIDVGSNTKGSNKRTDGNATIDDLILATSRTRLGRPTPQPGSPAYQPTEAGLSTTAIERVMGIGGIFFKARDNAQASTRTDSVAHARL